MIKMNNFSKIIGGGSSMFYAPFWIYLTIVLMVDLIVIIFRKLKFIDILIVVMIIAVTMSLDMLFCKQFGLYYYVNINYKGWYSFWANFVITPATGYIFTKYIPHKNQWVMVYIIVWSVVHTLLELYILKPLGIVQYPKWKILPWSIIGYLFTLSWTYIYLRILKKRVN